MNKQIEIDIDELDLLDDKERQLLMALVQSPSISDAAQSVGIPRSTAYRMVGRPHFRAARKAAGRQALAQTLTRLQQVTGQAVQVLSDISNNPKVHPRDRVAASRAILDQARRISEVTDLQDLEAQIEQLKEDRYGNSR